MACQGRKLEVDRLGIEDIREEQIIVGKKKKAEQDGVHTGQRGRICLSQAELCRK